MATSQQYYDICTHREVIWGIGIKGPPCSEQIIAPLKAIAKICLGSDGHWLVMFS